MLTKILSVVAVLFISHGVFGDDLFEREEFTSGFRPSEHCQELVTTGVQLLSFKMRRFRDLSLAEKIKAVHTLTHEEGPALSAEQLLEFSDRLRVLSEVSPRQLRKFSDEFLVIGTQLGQFIDRENFPEAAAPGFRFMLDAILSLPIEETEERMMTKGRVQANLAQVKILQMKFASGRQKALALDEATREITRTLERGLAAGGHIGSKWLTLPLDAMTIVIQQFDDFDESMKPHLREWLIRGMLGVSFTQPEEMFLKSGEPLPKEVADRILAIYEMPQTKRFPEVESRCKKFFDLLDKIIKSKLN